MRLTAIFLLAAALQASATGYSQQVTLSLRHAPLEKALAEIQKQTGYNVIYAKIELENANPVNLDVHNADLQQVLNLCFRNQPLAYTIEDKYVIVKRKPAEMNKPVAQAAPPGDVQGSVIGEDNQPLFGASVSVKGKNNTTSTDVNGYFTLHNVDPGATLVISFIGYKKLEVDANADLRRIKLMIAQNKLDEVQVIAYGTTTHRLNTGDVTTIKSVDIEKQPVNNPLLALEGRVSGMFISQVNGLPGGGITVQVRGQNSIAFGNDPLYVIDGVPYPSQLLPGVNNVLGSQGAIGNNSGLASGNPLSFINPSDIESIDILKDADATAIYGSRAANGAVLITTKKGKPGKTTVTVNAYCGWGQVAKKLDVLNTQQYLQMRREAFRNDGVTISPANYDLTLWDTTRNTDWQKQLIGGIAHFGDIQTSFSGGNANTQFLIDGGYHHETAVFPGGLADGKGSVHFSVNNNSPDNKFSVLLTGSFLSEMNHLQQTDLTKIAMTLAPDAPPLTNPDGTLNWAHASNGFTSWPNYFNPLSYMNQEFRRNTTNLISNAVLTYKILNRLEIATSLGYSNMQVNDVITNPLSAFDPAVRPFFQRSSAFAMNNISSWIVEPQLSYKIETGHGKFNALVGATINQVSSKNETIFASGFGSDLLLESWAAATSFKPVSINTEYKYSAVFGRLSYDYGDKYLINLTGRRDGSSRFGPDNRFHNFVAAGVGWIFSKEPLFERRFSVLSYGKLRASYGTTGNDQIGNYTFLDLYSAFNPGLSYQGTNGLLVNGLFNPVLQWEETRKFETGLDLGFFRDRILLSANYYRNRSSNELLNYSLPSISGFTSITSNFPATVQNSGIEFTLTTQNIKGERLNWTTSFNLTVPSNKLVSFRNLSNSSYATSLIIGKPITIAQVFHMVGVNDTTGIYQFADSKGNPTYSPSYLTDRSVIENTAPQYYGGLENNITFKRFELDFLFQFVKQIGTNYLFRGIAGNFNNGLNNQPTSVLDRWQNPGDNTLIEKYSQNSSLINSSNYALASDQAYSDASFIRLKNVSFSYELPSMLLKRIHIQNVRLYCQGQNLLTITKYKGLDPETKSSLTLPPLRIISAGIKITL